MNYPAIFSPARRSNAATGALSSTGSDQLTAIAGRLDQDISACVDARRAGLTVLTAAVLIASWLVPFSRALWNQLDATAFHASNASLAWGSPWTLVWAVTNSRQFDSVAGLAILAFVIRFVSTRPQGKRFVTALSFGITAGFAYAWRWLVCEIGIETLLEYSRPSPTAVHGGALRLSEMFTYLAPKDISPWSFPSDHGFVLLVVAGFFIVRAPARWACGATALACLLALPRLISGAHWATDIVVGSGSMALGYVAIFLFTPLHDRILARAMALVRARPLPVGVPG